MELKSGLLAPTLLLRFSGSGWMLAFHCGVGKFIQQHMDVTQRRLRFAGHSGGSLIAAALATGVDLDSVYEEFLDISEQCKRKPYRLKARLRDAIRRLAPKDEVWQGCSQRLVVGLAQRAPGGRGWRGAQVTEFRSREHALQVLEASNQMPGMFGTSGAKVDGQVYHDGALAGLVPDITPQQLGLNADPAKGAVDPVLSVDVCAWGTGREGCLVFPGAEVPGTWLTEPQNPSVLHTLYLLGFCRAAECFLRADRAVLEGLWRPGFQLPAAALTDTMDQVEGLLEDLAAAREVPGCWQRLLSRLWRRGRGRGSPCGRWQLRLSDMSSLHVKQLPLPKTDEVLKQLFEAQAPRVKLPLPDDPAAVVAYEKAWQIKRHRRVAAAQYRRASLQMYLPGTTHRQLHVPTGPGGSDPRRASLQLMVAGGDPRRASLQFGQADQRRASLQMGYPSPTAAGGAGAGGSPGDAGGPLRWASSKKVFAFTAEQRRKSAQAVWDAADAGVANGSAPPSQMPSPLPSKAPSKMPSAHMSSPLSKAPSMQLPSPGVAKGPLTRGATATSAATPPRSPVVVSQPAAAAPSTVFATSAVLAMSDWSSDRLDVLDPTFGGDAVSEGPPVGPSGVLCLERAGTSASGGGGTSNGGVWQASLQRRRSSGCSANKVSPLPPVQVQV